MWLSAGYYYTQLIFIDGDFSPAAWNKPEYYEFGLMTDAYLILFLSLSLLCTLYLVRAHRDKPFPYLALSAVSGLVAGVCISIKLNGTIAVVIIVTAVVLGGKVKKWGRGGGFAEIGRYCRKCSLLYV